MVVVPCEGVGVGLGVNDGVGFCGEGYPGGEPPPPQPFLCGNGAESAVRAKHPKVTRTAKAIPRECMFDNESRSMNEILAVWGRPDAGANERQCWTFNV